MCAAIGADLVGAFGALNINTEVAVAAGQLIERERLRGQDSRDRWPPGLEGGRKKKLRGLES